MRSSRLMLWALCLHGCLNAQELHLQCEVSYTPARSTWVRNLALHWQDEQLTSIQVDGVTPYSFALNGEQLLTAVDNEQIVLDMAALTWQSDFRDKAWGRGSCNELAD